jgi:hypothetical protein
MKTRSPNMIPIDKIAHALIGAVIALALGYVMAFWIALICAIAVGFAKELYDHFHPHTHTCDGNDFLATAFGGLAASIYMVSIK